MKILGRSIGIGCNTLLSDPQILDFLLLCALWFLRLWGGGGIEPHFITVPDKMPSLHLKHEWVKDETCVKVSHRERFCYNYQIDLVNRIWL